MTSAGSRESSPRPSRGRDELLRQVPNPAHESVPDDETDDAEGEIERRVGDPPSLAEPKEHLELGRYDMERGARLSGSRFGYIVGDAARLSLALYSWALDRLVAEGFAPVIPPVLVREEAMYGTGFFPAERFEIYEVADEGLFLTGTSEVALAGLHMGEILERERVAPRVHRLLGQLPARGRRRGARHARHVPRPPVQQGRDVRVHPPGRLVGRVRAARRDRGVARPGARAAVPRASTSRPAS